MNYGYYLSTVDEVNIETATLEKNLLVVNEVTNGKMVRSMYLSRVLDTFYINRSDMWKRMREWLEETHPEMML